MVLYDDRDSVAQYSTVQYSTVQYSTVQYSTVQYRTLQYSTVQCSTGQYCTVLYHHESKIRLAIEYRTMVISGFIPVPDILSITAKASLYCPACNLMYMYTTLPHCYVMRNNKL